MGAGTPAQGGKGGTPGVATQAAQSLAPQYTSMLSSAPTTTPVPTPQAASPQPMPNITPNFNFLNQQPFAQPQTQPQMQMVPPSPVPPMLKQFPQDMGYGYGRGLMALSRGVQGSGGYNSPYGATNPQPAAQLGAALSSYFDQFRTPK